MIAEFKKSTETKMHKSIDAYKANLLKIRVGRAHAGILDHIMVNYYGSVLPINQIATVTVTDIRTITVQPWESGMIASIDKAIRESDLGLNPIPSGTTIRVPMPILTEERRRELAKVVKGEAEEAKVSIRNIRREANCELKDKLKDKLISEDEEKRSQDEIQKLTDKFIIEVDKLTGEKEKELMTV